MSLTKPCSESLVTYSAPCLNQRDKILLGGRDQTEHREETVLKGARDHGITFNREKCQFGVEQIEFFRHVFTKDGLKPLPDKVRAVKECGVPENKEAVRSFLGMAGTWTTSSRIMQP